MSTEALRKVRVYVAGPYSKPDPVENSNRAIKVCTYLLDVGYAPFCPHLSLAWHLVTPRSYETWLEYDFEWIRACDVLYRIAGPSAGADREEDFADALGIPVVYSLRDLAKIRDELERVWREEVAKHPHPWAEPGTWPGVPPMGTPSER